MYGHRRDRAYADGIPGYADGYVADGPMPTGAVGIGLSRRLVRAMPTALAVGIGCDSGSDSNSKEKHKYC